jgi:hypothetical protein
MAHSAQDNGRGSKWRIGSAVCRLDVRPRRSDRASHYTLVAGPDCCRTRFVIGSLPWTKRPFSIKRIPMGCGFRSAGWPVLDISD